MHYNVTYNDDFITFKGWVWTWRLHGSPAVCRRPRIRLPHDKLLSNKAATPHPQLVCWWMWVLIRLREMDSFRGTNLWGRSLFSLRRYNSGWLTHIKSFNNPGLDDSDLILGSPHLMLLLFRSPAVVSGDLHIKHIFSSFTLWALRLNVWLQLEDCDVQMSENTVQTNDSYRTCVWCLPTHLWSSLRAQFCKMLSLFHELSKAHFYP